MSASEQITTEDVLSTPLPDSAATVCPLKPGSVHLLMADTALDEFHRGGSPFMVCGVVLAAADLPPWECPQGCGCDPDALICPDCVRRAAEGSPR